MYDREDDQWFGGERVETEITATIPIELFVEVELHDYRFVTVELLRTDYMISESYGWPDDERGSAR
jgi:hypothetical protein